MATKQAKPAKPRGRNRLTLPKGGTDGSGAGKSASSRSERASERRTAIIEAALDEFVARGFTATRLDDIAKRAGVAKGTIYLHFKDKESMFEELIRTALVPLIGRLAAPAVRSAAPGRSGSIPRTSIPCP
jgi:AcrR family transcriptional regulator